MKETDLFVVQRPTGVDSGTYKVAASDIPANAVVSATAPTDPMDGALWFDSSSNTLKTWDGSAWVESSASGTGVSSIIAGDGISVNQGTGDVTITNTGGGGGGGTTINYNGASAWGAVDRTTANGACSVSGSLNIASVTRTGTGSYDVVFATPLPSADYSVVGSCATVFNVSNQWFQCNTKSATGFTVQIVYTSGGTVSNADADFNFQVFSQNALPPKGGTGTDAWASVNSSGVIESSFNIASLTKTAGGEYDVVFTTPMPTSGYAISGASDCGSTLSAPRVFTYHDKSATGFKIRVKDSTNSFGNEQFSFTVNATNATLPLSFTSEQIDAAINNPGASAWGNFNGIGGVVINGSLNVASITRTNTGRFTVTFTTPMPDANYSVVCSTMPTPNGNDSGAMPRNLTANGFDINIQNFQNNWADSELVTFAVFATNALPLTGGTGTDAWGTMASSGVMAASFNATSSFVSTGAIQVTFTNPMPSANYAVTTGGLAPNVQITNKLTTGFTFNTSQADGAATNYGGSFTVNATNAVLPQAFTEQEVQQVVDLAKSGVTNPGASAWGNVDTNGNLVGGINCSSTGAAGDIDITFLTPMPNANYAVTLGTSAYNSAIRNQTATGFKIITDIGGSETTINSFAVFATNSLPLKGGTGTDAWVSVTSASTGAIGSSFNIDRVVRVAEGTYDVFFVTNMPTNTYSVQATSYLYNTAYTNLNTDSFRVLTYNSGGSASDAAFSAVVNATNATLPTSFTEAQIQSVLDFIAVANPAGVARSWGRVQPDGTIDASFNVASITRVSTGTYNVVFTTPMPTNSYALNVTAGGDEWTANGGSTNQTKDGFTAKLYSTIAGAGFDCSFSFTVHSY